MQGGSANFTRPESYRMPYEGRLGYGCWFEYALARKLQDANPGFPVVDAKQQKHILRVVDRRELFVTEKMRPVTTAIHTNWGPTVLRSQRFAIMPGADDIV